LDDEGDGMEEQKQLMLVDSDGKKLDYFVKLTMRMNDRMSKEDEAKCREIFDRAMSELHEAFTNQDGEG
jgi:hypothetical protein